MKQKIHTITFLIFLLLVALPWIQKSAEVFKLPTLDENRNRAKFPDGKRPGGLLLEHIYNFGVPFTAEYEKAYNDHYGFRDFLILLKNQLDFSLFQHSDEILIGKDGYLFFRDMVEKDLIKSERVTDEKIHSIEENILKFGKFLNSRNIKLAFLLCRDKESVYSELISSPTATRPKRVRSEEYVDFFNRQKDILFFDSKVLLERAKQIRPTYYKTDFHWNSVGAAFMGRRLINGLSESQGGAPLWKSDPVIVEAPGYSGTQNLYLATFSPKNEVAYEVEPTLKASYEILTDPPYPFENYARLKEPRKNVIPKTVIIGNSFTPYFFKTDFPAYFEEVGYIFKGHLRATPIEKLLPEGTKIVVLQVNEFDLGTFYTDQDVWKFLER